MGKLLQATVSAILIFAAGTVSAVTITFDSLTGGFGAVFTSTTEAGFNVVAMTPYWHEAHFWGNPVPSIFNSQPGVGTIQVTAVGSGTFSFDSVDFGCGLSAFGPCTGTAQGLLSGVPQFLFATGLLNNNRTFTTFAPPGAPAFVIDALLLSLDRHDSNIDNIVVRQVPEPATLALIGIALAGLGFSRRKRAS